MTLSIYIYTHTYIHIYMCVYTHFLHRAGFSFKKQNKNKQTKRFQVGHFPSPQLCGRRGLASGLPQGEPRAGPVCEHGAVPASATRGECPPTHVCPEDPLDSQVRPSRTKGFLLGIKWDQHLVRALSLTLLAASLGKPP